MSTRAGGALACMALALGLVPFGAGVAAAHGEEHAEPGADLPRILAVEPPAAGLTVTVIEGGLRVRVDNATATTVTAPEAGQAIAPGASAAWAEPRLGAPAWRFPLVAGDVEVTVSGDRTAPVAPDPVPWWSFTLAAALFTVALGAAAAEDPRGRARLGLAAAALLVVGAHAVHVVGAAVVLASPPGVGTFLAAAGPGLVCWVLGLAGAALVVARNPLGTSACASAGALAALLTAFDVAAFHDAVLAFGWPFDLDRATVVGTLGGGVGLLVTGVLVLGRADEPAPDGQARRPTTPTSSG